MGKHETDGPGHTRDARLAPIEPAPTLKELFPDGVPSHLDPEPDDEKED